MERIRVEEVKSSFDDVISLVQNAKQRVMISDGKGDRAALIPLEDLALLERLDGDINVAVERVAADEVVRHLEADLDLVSRRAQRIIVKQDDQEVVALVPQRDLSTLQNLDDRLDIEAAKRLLQQELEDGDSDDD